MSKNPPHLNLNFVIEQQSKEKTGWELLTDSERRAFAKDNYGFLQDVVYAVEDTGMSFSFATISRTWNGQFKQPNPRIVEVIHREYERLLRVKQENPSE